MRKKSKTDQETMLQRFAGIFRWRRVDEECTSRTAWRCNSCFQVNERYYYDHHHHRGSHQCQYQQQDIKKEYQERISRKDQEEEDQRRNSVKRIT